MNVFAYVRPVDGNNHAPHVSHGLLSLANCVWQIRERAKVDDWLVGLTSIGKHPDGRRLSYVARVDKKITRREYWENYARAYNSYSTGRRDNYYEPSTCNPFFTMHHNDFHTSEDMEKDLASGYVLLSRTFVHAKTAADLAIPWGWDFVVDRLAPPAARGYRKFPVSVLPLGTLKGLPCSL